MKFDKTDVSKDGKERTRYWFAIGKSEAVILLSALNNAIHWTPRTVRTASTMSRLRQMKNEVEKAIPNIEEQGTDSPEY